MFVFTTVLDLDGLKSIKAVTVNHRNKPRKVCDIANNDFKLLFAWYVRIKMSVMKINQKLTVARHSDMADVHSESDCSMTNFDDRPS